MLNTVCKLHCTQYGCFDAVPKIAQANCQMLINESLTFIQKTERNFSAWFLRLLCMELVLVTEWMWSFLDSRPRWKKVLDADLQLLEFSDPKSGHRKGEMLCCLITAPCAPLSTFPGTSSSLEMFGLPSQGRKLLISTFNLTLWCPWIITYHTCPTYTGTIEVCSSVAKSGSHTQPRFTLRTAVEDWSVLWALWFCVLWEQGQSCTSISVRDSNAEQFMLNSSFNQFSSVEKEEREKILTKHHFCLSTLIYWFCANTRADLQC